MAFQLENTERKTQETSSEKTSILKKEIELFNQVFSSKIKEDFYIELSILLKAGISLKDALILTKEGQKKKKNNEVIDQLSDEIVSGKSFYESMKNCKYFSKYEYISIKIGEETGTLDDVIEQLGEFYKRKNEQRRSLISALTYPIIILSTAVFVVIFMLHFVVPMFEDIFKQQGVQLPFITKVIVGLSEFIQNNGTKILLAIIGLVILFSVFKNKPGFKKIKDKFVLKIPFIGNFIKLIYLAQFTQAVSLLTGAKVPILYSIELVKEMILFYPLQNALDKVEKELIQGKLLSDSLAEDNLFSKKMIAMVKVAEETNQTTFIFQRLNSQLNTQVQLQSKQFSTVLEPIIIVFVGGIVGFILIAMYLPMFKLSSVLG